MTAVTKADKRYAGTRLSFERSVETLRREVVRAIRHEQLEFRYTKGGTFRPTAKSWRGQKWSENGSELVS